VIAALLAGGVSASLVADRHDPPHPGEEATRRPPAARENSGRRAHLLIADPRRSVQMDGATEKFGRTADIRARASSPKGRGSYKRPRNPLGDSAAVRHRRRCPRRQWPQPRTRCRSGRRD
jgi:hypothetical protein